MPRPLSVMVSAVAFLQRHLDPVGVARDRLVHRIVEHFGGEVVERALVGAADIHAGAAADGLEPFQHLDRGAIIGLAMLAGSLSNRSFAGLVAMGTAIERAEFRAASGLSRPRLSLSPANLRRGRADHVDAASPHLAHFQRALDHAVGG